MKKLNRPVKLIFAIAYCLIVAYPAAAQNDSLMNILEMELNREFKSLSKASYPAYYMHYHVDDVEYASLNASFGSLIQSSMNRNRVLATQVRIGDYKFDNTHPMSRQSGFIPPNIGTGPAMLPVENNELSLRFGLWQSTQNEYKQALESYKAIRNATALKDSIATGVGDFSNEPPEVFYQEAPPAFSKLFDKKTWEEKVKMYSAPFLKNTDVVEGDVMLRFTIEKKYFLNSEGSRILQYTTSVYLNVSGSIRANDGDIVPLHLSYYAPVPSGLPSDEKIIGDVEKMIVQLNELKSAPLAEPYSGPAILLAQTAGVFFHEIFGHRIEGHRLKNEFDGQTFKSRLNELVLPKTLSVSSDPTVAVINGHAVNGSYRFDDEGVKSSRVNVVDKGVLKTFLMSRTPLENIDHSNGHGRAALGASPVSRQSNLIVESSRPATVDDLRKMLSKECKKLNKRYGYLFKEVVGGFTVTDRYNPNAFNIFPTLVYRVYADGRPDELVRGVDLIGTPLAMFAEIQAAANDTDAFIGFCGAESGSVPVSAVAPSMFVRRIETQKKPRQHQEAMLLDRPTPSIH
ncbi:MAG: metallopeptidase TldD-related protein [Chryseolinea sp.]